VRFFWRKSAVVCAFLALTKLAVSVVAMTAEDFETVTPEAVAKTAADTIHPEHLVIVAVGDRAKIQPELEKLNLGPIEIRDASGDPVKQ
jgi:zinc protease